MLYFWGIKIDFNFSNQQVYPSPVLMNHLNFFLFLFNFLLHECNICIYACIHLPKKIEGTLISVCIHKYKNRPSKKSKNIKLLIEREKIFNICTQKSFSNGHFNVTLSKSTCKYPWCMYVARKCLPYFYVKILHQKNVITFFKWDLVFSLCTLRSLGKKKLMKIFFSQRNERAVEKQAKAQS